MQNKPTRERLPDFGTVAKVVELLRTRKKIIVLTGAGVSTSCGIPDFRSKNGVYSMLGQFDLDEPVCLCCSFVCLLFPFTIGARHFFSFPCAGTTVSHTIFQTKCQAVLHLFFEIMARHTQAIAEPFLHRCTREARVVVAKLFSKHCSFLFVFWC